MQSRKTFCKIEVFYPHLVCHLLLIGHLLEIGFWHITKLWNSLIQILSYHDLAFLSPKMCRKKFENRFTNKNLTPKSVFELVFLHGQNVSKGSHYFLRKVKVLIFYLKFIKPTPDCKGPNIWINSTNLPESKVKDFWIISLAYVKSLFKNIFGH